MENPSFRAILQQMLEPNGRHSSPPQSHSIPARNFLENTTIFLNFAELNHTPHRSTKVGHYTSRKVQAPPRVPVPPPAPVEKLVPLNQLKDLDHRAAQILIEMGAVELQGGLSLRRVKKAHRGMVKTLHPDHWDRNLEDPERESRAAQFMSLQGAYERLSRHLPNY